MSTKTLPCLICGTPVTIKQYAELAKTAVRGDSGCQRVARGEPREAPGIDLYTKVGALRAAAGVAPGEAPNEEQMAKIRDSFKTKKEEEACPKNKKSAAYRFGYWGGMVLYVFVLPERFFFALDKLPEIILSPTPSDYEYCPRDHFGRNC
ncbi:hypothetical protein [Synechococcus sp. CC9311]|uniref:hypothetical protein n=1 Tax=Synechococcus sp. (strain CC9311) TaxID=64471 RepID=UPI0000DDB24F|nr:hypothetical protein [Synechococcus sp. CC9311]ABI45734.1 hypothetical protein sync_2417 [Synechococcus sp. CC9311]|eukprot:CAMPEP_0175911758 /NCGR_PEP_ID=MMETSP0108-20121206/8364_1 /TAXON_ID=195067 ORGANISM="Goniomonas pacifica, Strain CCMP1869" /NCGR_SAMPLE_ID=MMETSP0108 /ASSEMBLY_ACC=CAM_ASM_000204 /LENGTH=149 /DNA_ID=CAMNT_0017234025 /DNA_START=241 /DNA_END=690 /DNA_ORIENTATION=+